MVDLTKEETYSKDLGEFASFFNCTAMSAKGICEGITVTWLQAALTDSTSQKEHENKFKDRIKFLLEYMTVNEDTP